MRAIKTTTISILAVGLLAGSTIGVVAQDEEPTTGPSTPTIVTGSMQGDGEPVEEGVDTVVDGVTQGRGFLLEGRQFEADDPRLTGTVSIAGNADIRTIEGSPSYLLSNSLRIENEEGSWSGLCDNLVIPDGRPDPFSCLFSGEGAYDDLSAYLVFENPEQPPFPYQGLIFEGDPPPMPEMPPAE